MTPYLLVALAAALVAYVATPMAGAIATRIGAIDHPNDRKVHAKPTPTLGGMAIFMGLVAAGIAAVALPELKQILSQSSAPLGIVAAGVVIFALGAVDDENIASEVKESAARLCSKFTPYPELA